MIVSLVQCLMLLFKQLVICPSQSISELGCPLVNNPTIVIIIVLNLQHSLVKCAELKKGW